jgi:hypothetical protein
VSIGTIAETPEGAERAFLLLQSSLVSSHCIKANVLDFSRLYNLSGARA